MKKKTKTYLTIAAVILAIIAVLLVYVYFVYGWMAAWALGFALLMGFVVVLYMISEARKPPRRTTLEEDEREKAYQQELGRLKAQRDWAAYERKEREYARWYKETYGKPPWLWR